MGQSNYKGALQKPIASGFTAASTSKEVIQGIDLTGKVAIVTGGNTGIGLETVRTLTDAGATVIVGARDVQKAKHNLQGIAKAEIAHLDLMDPDSIETFAQKFLSSDRPLHLLINNAGIMWVPLRRNKNGTESQLRVNYLAQFHLTARLWSALKKAGGARVVNVSSQGHHFAPFNFEDPDFEHREYETLQGYGQSKTAVNLFSLELASRAGAHHIKAYSVHPGSIGETELAREAPLELFIQMGFYDASGKIRPEVAAALKSIPQGAATTVWCATSPLLEELSGVYCEDVNVAALTDEASSQSGVMSWSLNEDYAKRLWKWSEEQTGILFQAD